MSQNIITGILGAKGSGKTFLARSRFRAESRAVCFDLLAEYEEGAMTESLADFCEFLETRHGQAFLIRVRAGSGAERIERTFGVISGMVFAVGDCALYVEEIDYFCDARSSLDALDTLIRYGRHRRVNLTWTTRRFAEVSKGLTSQTDVFYLFRMSEPGDLDAIAHRFGDETAGKVRNLKGHDHIMLDVSGRTENADLIKKSPAAL